MSSAQITGGNNLFGGVLAPLNPGFRFPVSGFDFQNTGLYSGSISGHKCGNLMPVSVLAIVIWGQVSAADSSSET
jgi:hypothetical protein